MKDSLRIQARWFPEIGAGGFSSLDGTIEFYTRINALLESDMNVLNFGAGRGAALTESECNYKKQLMTLRGKAAHVIACDIDDVVLNNPGADEVIVAQRDKPLPFNDGAFDLIVSDYVFEHIEDPELVSAELQRILKPGGWICARTPNKYSLISLVTRLVHNSQHPMILSWAQPDRKMIDVFPTVFKLNSKRDIARWFPSETFDSFIYRYEAEPSYFFTRSTIFALMLLINQFSPPVMKSSLFIFLRKK